MQRRIAVFVTCGMSVMVSVTFAIILSLRGDHLIYTLDDPHISLALSQHIARGHYGINAVEASSPSSSILYTLMLAAFARLRWQEWVPFWLNTMAACATASLIAVEIVRLRIITLPGQIARGAVLTLVLCISFNVIGLLFIGLEHSLHVLTSVLVVIGLARVLEGDSTPPWLVLAIILLPLWRIVGVVQNFPVGDRLIS